LAQAGLAHDHAWSRRRPAERAQAFADADALVVQILDFHRGQLHCSTGHSRIIRSGEIG
jgi:hypothetical protein